MGVRERIEVMSSAMQGISEAEKKEVMQGWCQNAGDFELSWIQDLARQERWRQNLRRNQEEGREEMLEYLQRMRNRASNQGNAVGSRWWRDRIQEWNAGDRERMNQMQDHHGTGNWGEGVRMEWRAFQAEQREADRRAGGPRARRESSRRQRRREQVWRLELESGGEDEDDVA